MTTDEYESNPTGPLVSDAELDRRLKARRVENAVSAFGPLALVNSQRIDAPQPVWGVPGLWSPLPDGQSGLLVTAEASDGILVDGDPVDGDVIVAGADAMVASTLVFDDHTRGTVVRVEDGGYALRVWDSRSEAVDGFQGIAAFDYDPAWVVPARLDGDEVTFEREGESHTLEVRREGKALQLIFSDATSGVSSYSMGRFLFFPPSEDGEIELDFNRAVLPPCAFSYQFSCPIPPARNRLDFEIAAGEKTVLTVDGDGLH
ncbi:DUF1684 domain-containing protein [Amnibacterium flavum]|uniref:DUF1684 domain-containing protein n=1 Tax=Amnibacterium flavum TaxID=2173173 RepID=A0A2V1HNJ4_9MICO|nr:DUF1684 domain-containing protein [Amnibacterium flavum]PVZ94203.1 DUF1684 domain-containing protein [Amnibacterium flavum]